MMVIASRKHVTWLLGRDGDVRVSVIGEEEEDELRSSKVLQSLLNNRCQSRSVEEAEEEETESGSAGEETRGASSDSDCESGVGAGDSLQHHDWASLRQPRLRNHGNRPPLRTQSLDADRTLPLDGVAMGGPAEEPAFGRRVAQLKRTFAPGTAVSSKPPVPVKPPHLQPANRSVPRGVPEGIAAR
ncbi:hypothetical protein CRUP_010248 [Coryphaenoides rupestris]|nr:hypothetical protein CRUP_010248 [Coryphaenoides rupestris]